MQLSSNTVSILQGFSSINPSIVIKKGSLLSTMSNSRLILANAKIEEDFPMDIGIYELGQFLNNLSLFNKPELEFSEGYISISDDSCSAKYHTADPEIIAHPPKSELTLPSVNIEFTLTESNRSTILKAVGKTNLPMLKFSNKNGSVVASLVDIKNPLSNTFDIVLDASTTDKFEIFITFENIKVVPGNYNIKFHISSNMSLSEWTNDNGINKYWIALAPQSTFG